MASEIDDRTLALAQYWSREINHNWANIHKYSEDGKQ